MVKGTKKELTIKWILRDKRVVKFQEEDDTYDLADNVKNEYLEGIDAGVSVKVTIDDGKITYMQKSKATKRETVKDTKPENNEEQMTCTINAMTSDKSVVKFEKDKDNKKWYIITDEVKSDFEKLNKGDVVDVTLGKVMGYNKAKTKKFPKDAVIAVNFSEKQQSEKDTNVDLTTTPYYSNNGKNDSIERQCALKSATEIVVALIDKDAVKKDAIKDAIKDLTKACYNAIQEA